MGSEYDRKFEEMKKYIPFLESMIKRLESNTSSSSNPRQAQLDKIRSLRDLLLDKKKRMKMDNLLKCEQVLVNLYAKVEQKDTLPVVKVENIESSKDSIELEAVRNKLKTVIKMKTVTETLPEIARASEIEEICEPGSKEPALFQRRPNRSSSSPPKRSPKKVHETMLSPKAQSRRYYTRVLVSPDRRPPRWPSIEGTSSDKQLFSRRSPIKAPRRNSPPYHKKERKKSSNSREGKSRKDLNITLKVPEESLHSLNTDDILSRIINCSDGDVDIDTLRELRSQILGELKQTGSNDDISEIILKSYNKKSKPNKKKKELEVEEGEISDSESEAIENVYGSLLVMDKDKKPGQVKSAAEKNNQQRKIQICLVINSDKDGGDKPVKEIDLSESGVFKKSDDVICVDSDTSPSPKKNDKPKDDKSQNNELIDDAMTKTDKDKSGKAITTEINDSNKSDPDVATNGNKNNTVAPSVSPTKTKQSPNKSQVTHTQVLYSPSQCLNSPSLSPVRLQGGKLRDTNKKVGDFLSECDLHPENPDKAMSESTDRSKPDQSQKSDVVVNTTSFTPTKEQNSNEEKTEDTTEIPLLNEPTLPPKAKKDVLSEIDILQALKNEILSETISIAATEVDTPALHKPKLTKVASAMETGTSTLQAKSTKASKSPSGMPKKRISIENYKKKSETVVKSLFVKRRSNAEREEMKKQSLKLTEKECERFNFSRRISLDDDTDSISDDDLLEDAKLLSMDDIYSDLAPKSPDQDTFSDDVIIHDDAPVLIPMEPVKSAVFTKPDVDFRTISTPPQPVPPPTRLTNVIALALSTENSKIFEPNKVVSDGNRNTLVDPRLRRDLSQPAGKDSPNSYKATNIEGTLRVNQFPIPPLLGPIITPTYTPSYAPSMTPIRTPNARSYEMTPLRQTVEESQQKHVYAPSFPMCDNRENSFAKDVVWEPNKSSNSNDDLRSKRDARNSRWQSSKISSTQRNSQPNFNPRNDKFHIDRRDPSTTSAFGWTDCPSTPGSSFGLLDKPMTPSHSFGRSDCPPTPSHPFGRSECPATPSHPFGRSECPATPSHSFGRSECPATPSHPFGRSECPATPSHSFGRSECPPTPNHQFGRPDFNDPRLNRRQSDYEPRTQYDDRDDGYQNDRSYNRSNSYKSNNKRLHGGSDSPRNYEREQHFGRNDRYHNEKGDRYSKNVSDLPQHFEIARSFGRNDKKFSNEPFESALPREDRLFTRNRDSHYDSRYSDHNEEFGSRRNLKEKGIGKATLGEPIRARRQSVSKIEYDNKSLSEKRQADRSFTIDTSVNSTFQNIIESGKGIQVFDYTFDARRQRATSVGRSLVRESSVNHTMSQEAKSKERQSTDSTCFSRRSNFQRASSVGRVIVDNKNEKTFQEIKADFESYRSKNTTKETTKHFEVLSKKDDIVKKGTLELNSRSRKDNFEKHGRSSKHIAKQPYSPKKNTRDPRMRMDHKDSRNNRNDKGSSNSWDRRHSGISYSNDNIAKGTIMGTGLGVKNYKIPKIKRPEPEPSKTPVEEVVKESEQVKTSTPKLETIKKVKSKDKNSDDEISNKINAHLGKKLQEEKSDIKDKVLSDDGNKSKNKDHKTSITSESDCEKRVTRSSKKSDSSQKDEPVKNTKRIRKAIIDSDSDDELAVKTINENTKIKSKPKESETPTKQNISEVSKKDRQVKHSQGSIKTKSNSNKEPNGSKQHKLNADSEKIAAERELRKTLEDDSLDSSFGMDDMEIFSSDNIVSDPVIDNINDLIADLDHDISATKSTNDNFTTEMEKMMGAIDSQEENTLGDISELIEKDLNESNESVKQILTQKHDKILVNELELATGPQNTTPIVATTVTQKKDTANSITSQKTLVDTDQPDDPNILVDKILETKEINNGVRASIDETVSTTHIDQSNSDKDASESPIANKTDAIISEIDQSVPDSTIIHNDDVPEKLQESLPDSTMEIHSEVSSDVTSTLNDTEKSSKETAEPSLSCKEVSAIESFGSLLSILQDKTKIKQFLSMLGGQSAESEKLKKKLEKLSEIVSDEEEDANDKQSSDCDTNKSDKISPEILSNEITDQSTDTQEAEINKKTVNLNAGNENDEPDKKSDTEKSNDVELCKDDKIDLQPENKKAPPLEESKLVNNEEPKDVIAQTSDEQIHDDQTFDDPTNDDLIEDLKSNENQDEDVSQRIGKTVLKKTKVSRKGKGKVKRGKVNPKKVIKSKEVKLPNLKNKIQKRPKNRELYSLQNDIKEMFMCDEVLNATGIRMCRLAKMVDKKAESDSTPKDSEPLVLLQKFKGTEDSDEPVKKLRKKPGPKPKPKIVNDPTKKSKSFDTEGKFDKPKNVTGYKPGPKSRTKQKHLAMDPYEFETDSAADTTKESDANSSDSENESIVSSESFRSSELSADTKKKTKKKRNIWQSGVIKPRHKKKKEHEPQNNQLEVSSRLPQQISIIIPDFNCFTDKMYCFQRGVFEYDCRLCHYTGSEIVSHYRKEHAHTEVPLSRMDPRTAKKAIKQCEEINFHLISKIPSETYTCRFCYKEFRKQKVALEDFFWHVVSTHTGEFKHMCYECVNVTRCPLNLDIPSAPKNVKGQLIGFICGKCNYTQISLENLKTHVLVRHNDEQTEVYTISMGAMSPKVMKEMIKKSLSEEQEPRTLRSSRSIQSAIEASDDRSEITGSNQFIEVGSAVPKKEQSDPHVDATLTEIKRRIKPGPMKCKIRFETDDQERSDESSVKLETEPEAEYLNDTSQLEDTFNETTPLDETLNETSEFDQSDTDTVHLSETFNESSLDHTLNTTAESDNVEPLPKYGKKPKRIINKLTEARGTIDVFTEPHFKLNYKETGAKEYVCCINGTENHYRTTLLISLKKHIQTKHLENWDGYCCLCKVIVTLQGVQCSFKDCLTHFLDKHMDDFPIMEKVEENTKVDSRSAIDASIVERTESPKNYIAVRPLTDLISKDVSPVRKDIEAPCPIENVVGIGNITVEVPQVSPVYPTTSAEVAPQPIKPFQYEEVQAVVMSKKHRIVLPTMMPKELLIRVFKCAGHYCSFTSDSAEDSLVHAMAHKQLGGEGAMDCAYCNFNAAGNAIDLVTHVFKEHGRCHFSCELCFYRAAAETLVGAHFSKAHGATGKAVIVLRTTSVVNPAAADSTNMLPRETAVLHYVCNHGEGSCKFRTYTPVKFYDHMQEKHGSANFHPCDMCDVTKPTPIELVKHMKDHGLQLYQCTWCVHGANSEAEMLSHAASFHPTKNPQAYLRIIKNKDHSKDLRVLPLIYLKSKVPIEDVTPSKVKEDPTREAERSIELEKLIKHTTLKQDNLSDNATNPILETPEVTEAPAEITTEACDSADEQTVQAIVNSLLSPPLEAPQVVIEPSSSAVKDYSQNSLTINSKIENVVYCLDSDEEEVAQKKIKSVINVSDDELDNTGQDTPVLRQLISEPIQAKTEKPKFKKLSLDVLFKCPNCEQNSRNVGGFKRHTNSCCLEMTTIRCPHAPCPIVLTNITQLINHYNKDHNALNLTKLYYCGVCKSRCSTLNVTKKHLKEAHGVLKVVISSKLDDDGTCIFTVEKETRPAERPGPLKRKASVETPKKYGIEDIDKLPINPIMDSLVYCNKCVFSTKVRLNMVRHLQQHAERQPVPQTAPVNPVPHLETNEKHFDRMVNLASSSAATRADKPPAVTPEAVSRYPKYVPERQRHTCGAQGCSYISVDEDMLRCHWETLHSAAVKYHCAHCPPHQHLDKTKLLNASRVIAHLKMHDVCLYACSSCKYYHYKKRIVEKHIAETHQDKGGHVQTVRDEGTCNPVAQSPAAVGTMDLRSWQCGLCRFRSMLRRDLIEHCSKNHQTKMQYKCAYCPFKTSDIENIVKHQSNAHPTKPADVFYYFYREGDVPNEADGTPRWQKQRQICGIQDTEVKTEPEQDVTSKTLPVDLNLVKKEVADTSDVEMSIEELCNVYGQFCDPNGISFKCSLCKTVMEYTRDAMQSHLYEELKYRRWSCAICTYKAYHKIGLNDHMASEHNRNFVEPSELPVNINIEKWVSKLLDHQSAIIDKNKVNNQPKIATEKPVPGPSKVIEKPKVVLSSDVELEQAFGSLGSPKDDVYCCPKCKTTVKDEDEMRNHLESELTKIRWCCTKCTDKFPTFHEAQFHCKSHPGPLSRPKEAIRDPSLRSAWVSAVINTQKKSMKPDTSHNELENINLDTENSLLVVRYEEAAPTEEQLRQIAREDQLRESRKRQEESDSDNEDSLVIYEPENKKYNDRNCPYCDFVSRSNSQLKLCMREHILRHYNLKVLTCTYCNHNASRKAMYNHLVNDHPGLPHLWTQTPIPNVIPSEFSFKSKKAKNDRRIDDEKLKVCLHCEASIAEHNLITHIHGNKPPEFGERGAVVVKCCICLTLRLNLQSMEEHYKETHPDITNLNYAYYKLQIDTREVQSCGICKRRFTFLRDLRIHHSAMHGGFNLSFNTVPYRADEDDHDTRGKRKLDDVTTPIAKRVAKKSTSKLPHNKIVARKSTTKLPVNPDLDEEYSYYGTRPTSFNQYENVKTMMPMYNTMVEIDVKKLSGILRIDPKVVVKDFMITDK